MDGPQIAALATLATAFGVGLGKLLDFFLARGKLQVDATITEKKVEAEHDLSEAQMLMQERKALAQEWDEMREEMKADRDRSRAQVDALTIQLQQVSEKLLVEQRARIEAEQRLTKIERELLDALGSRDYVERKLKRLENYVDLLLEVMRHHGIAPPQAQDEAAT